MMRVMMIGLGLGGQMVVNSTMEELQRMIYHAIIYEMTVLPLAREGRADRRFVGVPTVKRVLAEGIAFDAFFDTEREAALVEKGLTDEVRYEKLRENIKKLVKSGDLSKEDADDLDFFAEFVLWGKKNGKFAELADNILERSTFIVPLVINSSEMDFISLDDRMKPYVIIGATFDGRLVSVPRHPVTTIPPSNRLLIGRHLTHGGGAGWDNTVGMRMAMDSEVDIKSMISRVLQESPTKGVFFNMYVITYGSGGGTGSGSGPVVAKVLRELDPKGKILAFPILPAPEECRMRVYNSVTSLAFLAENADGVGLVSLEDYRGIGESIDDAYYKIDSSLGKFFVTMLGSEELPVIKNRIKEELAEIIREMRREYSSRWLSRLLRLGG